MKYTWKYITIAAFCALMAACGADEPEPVTTPDDSTVENGSGNVDDTAMTGGRTVLVYMVADNSLGAYDFDKSDLEEMRVGVRDGACGDDGRLLVYYNSPGTRDGNAPQLIEIRPEGDIVLKTYPDDATIYSTDVDRMREVLVDTRMLAPAGQYGLVLWSHATGWVADSGSRSSSPRSGSDGTISLTPGELRSFGDDRGRKMSLPSLRKGLEGSKFEFIYFDCCLMATIEVVYELRDITPWIVASTTELPADGTDYTVNLYNFFAPGKPDMVAAAKATFDHYNSLSPAMRKCTMTAVETAGLDNLARASRDIMLQSPQNGKEIGEYQILRNIRNNTLFDMADYYESFIGIDAENLVRWRNALTEVVRYNNFTPTAIGNVKITTHCGLGTWIYGATDDAESYSELQWWRDVVSYNPTLAK